MNAVILVLWILSGFIWINYVTPDPRVQKELTEVGRVLVKLRKQVNYGKLLMENINLAHYGLPTGDDDTGCGCKCGGPGGGNGAGGAGPLIFDRPRRPAGSNLDTVTEEDDDSVLKRLPQGPQTRGVTRDLPYFGTYRDALKATSNMPGFAKQPKPSGGFLSTAYYNLLYNLNLKAKKERIHYRDLVARSVATFNSIRNKQPLYYLGDPFRSVTEKFLKELSDKTRKTTEEILEPTTTRLRNYKRRMKVWDVEDRNTLNWMDTEVKHATTTGNALLDLIAKIKTHKLDEYSNTGEKLARDIMNCFGWLFWEVPPWLQKRLNWRFQVYNYNRRRLSGRRNSIKVKQIYERQARQANQHEDEVHTVYKTLDDLSDKVKYSRLLLEDLEAESRNLRGITGCECPACPLDNKANLDIGLDGSEELLADVALDNTLPNYYDTVNNGYLSVAYEMFTDAVNIKNPVEMKKVIIHAQYFAKQAIERGELDWLGVPMKRAVYSTAQVFTNDWLSEIRPRAARVANWMNNRYRMLSARLNNIIDYANSLIPKARGQTLIRTLEVLEQLPVETPTPTQLMKQIVYDFNNLFVDKAGTPELARLAYFADKFLVERYPNINNSKRIPKSRRQNL